MKLIDTKTKTVTETTQLYVVFKDDWFKGKGKEWELRFDGNPFLIVFFDDKDEHISLPIEGDGVTTKLVCTKPLEGKVFISTRGK